jgi:VanW like protein
MTPTRRAMLTFTLKSGCFRVRRMALDVRRGLRRWPVAQVETGAALAEVSTSLRSPDDVDGAELRLVTGKIENLRVALRRIDGTFVPAGGVFSFWRQIGRATRRGGYVEGRELREGCIVPSVGGGLCQLSNALYGAALDAGCEIVERHAHSQIVPGSLAERGRDATVFWNYVDLQFRPSHDLTIRAHLEADTLVVRFFGSPAKPVTLSGPVQIPAGQGPEVVLRSCLSCGQETCARHRKANSARPRRTAFILDACWPEFDTFVSARATRDDIAFVPLDGRRRKLPQYAWNLASFGNVREAPLHTFARSLRSRRLASQGAARQRALLCDAERFANVFGSHLPYDVEHVVVMQPLLPFLWRAGYLGGRTFDVLMTALPMRALHEVLDDAARLHPESKTLADFRAPSELVEAEQEALARARSIVTPHRDIARRFGERATLLPWAWPDVAPCARANQDAVLFAGNTLGRCGAYEVREAARRYGLRIVLVGEDEPEGRGFWRGIEVTRVPNFQHGLDLARAVVLPAFVEHRPRRLIHALAARVPVVASRACGLAPDEALTVVEAGDVDALNVLSDEGRRAFEPA